MNGLVRRFEARKYRLMAVLVLNFFVSSGSAKAFLLIPILSPLADLVGLSQQVAVQAFLFIQKCGRF